MDNQGKPSPYGNLVHKPEHYNILMQLETSRNPDYIKDPFINKNGTAGPLQLRRTAFEDLQKHGWLKDQEYNSISGPMATAAGMKYADLIANHYGLKDPYWNALAYKEGPTLAKKLYDRHKGSIKKALQDPEMPAEGVDYLIKYSKTKLADYAKQTAVSPYIKDMYNTITRGGDINSIDPQKYQTAEVPKFKEGEEVTNPGFLSFPGMTKYTAPFAPAVGMLSNAVGFNANTKSDLFQGAGLGALSGFLSGGLPGAVLGGGASLLAYGSKMAGEENAKYEAEQAELKAKTIPGRTGFESPLQYAAEGGIVNPNNISTPIDNTKTILTSQITPTNLKPIIPSNTYGYATKQINVNPVLDSVMVENGAPNINVSKLDDKGTSRANYNAKTNTINIGNNLQRQEEEIISELAHSKQFEPVRKTIDYTKDPNVVRAEYSKNSADLMELNSKTALDKKVYNSDKRPGYYYETKGDSLRYVTPGTLEYDAHEVIEPKIKQNYDKRLYDYSQQPYQKALAKENARVGLGVNTPMIPNPSGQVIVKMNKLTPTDININNYKEEGGYVEGKQYVLPEYEIKRLQSLGYIIE
jgi:hypothetical protein